MTRSSTTQKKLVKIHVNMVRDGTPPGPFMEALNCGRDLYVSAKLKSLDRETLECTIISIFNILHPHADVDKDWDSDTLDDVSRVIMIKLELDDVF